MGSNSIQEPANGGEFPDDNSFSRSVGVKTGIGDCEKSATFRVTIASNDAATAHAIRMLSSKSFPG